MNMDRAILSSVMLARIMTAKLSLDDAMEMARGEWEADVLWITSNAKGEGSFLWFCDQLDLEPDAVREATIG